MPRASVVLPPSLEHSALTQLLVVSAHPGVAESALRLAPGHGRGGRSLRRRPLCRGRRAARSVACGQPGWSRRGRGGGHGRGTHPLRCPPGQRPRHRARTGGTRQCDTQDPGTVTEPAATESGATEPLWQPLGIDACIDRTAKMASVRPRRPQGIGVRRSVRKAGVEMWRRLDTAAGSAAGPQLASHEQ